MNIQIKLTMHIEEDFEELKKKLLPLQFHCTRDGALSWTNPFESTQHFSIKPLRAGSTNYSVIISRNCDQLITMVRKCFGYFDCEVRQLHYVLTQSKEFNREDFRGIAKNEWPECSPYIFLCKQETNEELVCIVMPDNVTFHTRCVYQLSRIKHFMELCEHYSSFFVPKIPFNLFTLDEFAIQ